ncbi:hypothetical protein EVAR_90951_1 [Eumeta japonica]|uniref:Uncharacterized protein n=1 Tax=Eumeta variegata TaxID=151549 RepID=A0A4C1ZDB0_EUMVA|nr:hypothetical protein EVAR_90951_1 [Eumeta japonica]
MGIHGRGVHYEIRIKYKPFGTKNSRGGNEHSNQQKAGGPAAHGHSQHQSVAGLLDSNRILVMEGVSRWWRKRGDGWEASDGGGVDRRSSHVLDEISNGSCYFMYVFCGVSPARPPHFRSVVKLTTARLYHSNHCRMQEFCVVQ